jgi:hypothetical protein
MKNRLAPADLAPPADGPPAVFGGRLVGCCLGDGAGQSHHRRQPSQVDLHWQMKEGARSRQLATECNVSLDMERLRALRL